MRDLRSCGRHLGHGPFLAIWDEKQVQCASFLVGFVYAEEATALDLDFVVNAQQTQGRLTSHSRNLLRRIFLGREKVVDIVACIQRYKGMQGIYHFFNIFHRLSIKIPDRHDNLLTARI